MEKKMSSPKKCLRCLQILELIYVDNADNVFIAVDNDKYGYIQKKIYSLGIVCHLNYVDVHKVQKSSVLLQCYPKKKCLGAVFLSTV